MIESKAQNAPLPKIFQAYPTEFVRMKFPDGVQEVMWNGLSFKSGNDRCADVPKDACIQLFAAGFSLSKSEETPMKQLETAVKEEAKPKAQEVVQEPVKQKDPKAKK